MSETRGAAAAARQGALRRLVSRPGDLSTEMDGPGMDFELCMSIVRNLLAIEA